MSLEDSQDSLPKMSSRGDVPGEPHTSRGGHTKKVKNERSLNLSSMARPACANSKGSVMGVTKSKKQHSEIDARVTALEDYMQERWNWKNI